MARPPHDLDPNPDWSEAHPKPLRVPAKLQAIRARPQMSDASFASLIGVPLATLRSWELGEADPDPFARRMIDVIYDDPEGMRSRLAHSTAA